MSLAAWLNLLVLSLRPSLGPLLLTAACCHDASCSAMEFMVAIMKGVIDRPEETLNTVVQENYYATLHQWHGFLASSAFHVSGARAVRMP